MWDITSDSPAFACNITIVSYILFPQSFLTSIQFAGPALDMGVERLKSEYQFNITHKYLGFRSYAFPNPNQGMVDNLYLVSKYYYDEWDRNGFIAFISPGAEETFPLAILAREWDAPIITPTITDPSFANKRLYPTVISLTPMAIIAFMESIVAVLDKFDWTSVYVISDEGGPSPFYQLWIPGARGFLARRRRGPKVTLSVITGNTVKQGTEWFRDALTEASKYSRVIILSMNGYRVRDFLIMASLTGMTSGEYVYLTFAPYDVPRLTGVLSDEKAGDDANNKIAFQAFRSLLKIEACKNLETNSSTYRERQRLTAEFMRRSLTEQNFTYPPGEKPSEFIMATYDAVAIFGQLVNESLSLNKPLSGKTLAEMSRNRTFALDTGNVYVDPSGERAVDFCLLDFDVSTKQLKPVLVYSPTAKRLLNHSRTAIDWNNHLNTPPLNEPFCGYSGDNPVCNTDGKDQTLAIAPGVVIGFLILFCLSCGFLIMYRRKLERKDLTRNRSYIGEHELIRNRAQSNITLVLGKAAFERLKERSRMQSNCSEVLFYDTYSKCVSKCAV